MSNRANRVLEFGPFRLEAGERLLLRQNERIPLTPKAFETLLVLVEHSGRVVQKDDLLKQVWPDTIVEEANLARNIWTLRKVLADGNGESTYIETIPKVGYRFIAPVTEQPVETESVVIRRQVSAPSVTEDPKVPDAPDAPLPTTPTRRRGLAFVFVLSLFALAGVISVGLIRLGRAAPPAAVAGSGRAFLTDGSHEDMAAYWIDTGQIYFSRSLSTTRTESWTMNADGTNAHRANAQITSLLHGRWSPDGKRVVFTKDDDQGKTIYLADADGTHEKPLPFVAGNLDWSPDGSRFVYEARTAPQVSEIFMYTLATENSVNLTGSIPSADPSFSSDGTHIAFTSWRDGNAEIYVMDADGSHIRRLTNHPAFDSFPVFSPDDTQIAFQSNRQGGHVEIYLQNLNDHSPPRRLTHSTSTTGLMPKCWSPDGTRMLVYTSQHGKNQIELIDVEPFPAQEVLRDEAGDLSFPRLAADGRNLLYEAWGADGSLELRVTDLVTKKTTHLFKSEPGYPAGVHLTPAWSPDNSLVAFSASIGGNWDIFTIKNDGTGLRNLTRHPLPDVSPVFSPDGREIVFSRDDFGHGQLYRMDVNGGHLRRVTEKDGFEMHPAFSPDSVHLIFAGDREGLGLDILQLDLTEPRQEKVLAARKSHDTLPAFSPDGSRIAFIAMSDGNPEIYVMNADGGGIFRATHSKAEEAAPQFVGDGTHIIFSSNRGGKFALYQIDVR